MGGRARKTRSRMPTCHSRLIGPIADDIPAECIRRALISGTPVQHDVPPSRPPVSEKFGGANSMLDGALLAKPLPPRFGGANPKESFSC